MHNTPPASRRRLFRTSAGMGAVLAAATSTGASGASTPPHAAVRVRSGFVAGPSTYYEVLEPVAKTRKPPMVLIHGGAHTGSCYMATADGRPGWAPFFAAQGYQVVVPDWAGTGRSGYIPYDDLSGETVVKGLGKVLATLDRTPPELASDIVDKGLVVTGGTAQLPGLWRTMREATRLPVIIADDPASSVAVGAGRALTNLDLLASVAV